MTLHDIKDQIFLAFWSVHFMREGEGEGEGEQEEAIRARGEGFYAKSRFHSMNFVYGLASHEPHIKWRSIC